MISTRWRKIYRDTALTKGRMLMMIAAIAAGVFGVGTMLSAYSILTREIALNYAYTHPASAYIRADHLNAELLDKVRQQPGIEAAELASWVESRIEVSPNEWKPLLLFVSADLEHAQLNTVQSEAGEWPPRDGAIWLERTALDLIDREMGQRVLVQTPNGPKTELVISGTVHDAGLAPASQEQTVYGYATPSTLSSLGENPSFHILKVLLEGNPTERSTINASIAQLSDWLSKQGSTIEEIRIPPPGKHPHQTQLTAFLIMLLIFSFMALMLSAILTATIIGGLLAAQTRQIGIMKSIGARTIQVTGMYVTLVAIVGALAVILGLPMGIAAGRALASAVAELLNFTLYSRSIPLWNYGVLLSAGILLPLIAALFPVRQATRITVREAIGDYGVSRGGIGSARLVRWLGAVRGLDRTLLLALRNPFRRRWRLILTLGLLTAAGAMFLSSLNVKSGWDRIVNEAISGRPYDLELQLHQPVPAEKWLTTIREIPGVTDAESWTMEPLSILASDQLSIVNTYPDGGHGSFTLRSVPRDSAMIEPSVMKGHWLQAGGPVNEVVLNHNAHAMMPNVQVGQLFSVTIHGKPVTLTLAGVVRENLVPAAAYMSDEGYSAAVEPTERSNAFRIAVEQGQEQRIMNELEKKFDQENVHIKVIVSNATLGQALEGHVYMLIFALIIVSIIMASVGAIGLASTMGTSVIERTREFGVMRTIGGRSSLIIRNVLGEGLFIGMMSWVLAVLLSLPLSAAFGKMIGQMSFRSPLALIVSPHALLIWLMIVILGSAAACLYPAYTASRLTIRESIDHI